VSEHHDLQCPAGTCRHRVATDPANAEQADAAHDELVSHLRTAHGVPEEQLGHLAGEAQTVEAVPLLMGEQVAEFAERVQAETRREWAARVREVGTAKGWSVWAGPFMDPDVEFVDSEMPSTESIVAELRRQDRAAVLREVDARLGEMELPGALKGTLNAGSYAAAWRDCRAVVQRMAGEAGKGTRGGGQPPAGELTQATDTTVQAGASAPGAFEDGLYLDRHGDTWRYLDGEFMHVKRADEATPAGEGRRWCEDATSIARDFGPMTRIGGEAG
jgi:hypothetical protein